MSTEMNIDLSEFKFSKFNRKIYLENELYLYNSFTGGFGKVKNIYCHYFDRIDFRTSAVPVKLINDTAFLKSLLDGGFILYKDINENEMLEAIHNINRFGKPNSLGITIIPTIGCNFRCTYCYEKDGGYPNEVMNSNIVEETLKFIDTNLNDNGHLNVAWFGGEPLLGFNIIKKIQYELSKIAKEKDVTFISGIVTNGYLLTEGISNELVDLGISTAQITLDGDAETHDSRRKLNNGLGTYDRIVDNILKSNNKLLISIRVNIDKNNIDNANMLLNDLIESGVHKKDNVSIYFSIVRDYDTSKEYLSHECYNMKEFSGEQLRLHKLSENKGMKTAPISIEPNLVGCGSVSPRTFVIEPDGTIQKCWHSVGVKDHAVGHLLPEENKNNKHLYLGNQYKWYSWHGYSKNKCKNCDVLPLCMGGCPYYDIYPNKLFESSAYGCTPLKYSISEALKYLALNGYSNEN